MQKHIRIITGFLAVVLVVLLGACSSSRENTPRLYVDAVAITSGVGGLRYEKCLELINIMAEADVMKELSVQDGAAQ